MSDITIFGAPLSTYVRTVRMQLEEKDVPYELEPLAPNGDEIRKYHPFGKIPAFRHEGQVLFETDAICRYIERNVEGKPLQPSGDPNLALMDQWIGATNSYFYPTMIRGICLPRFGMAEADEAAIAASADNAGAQIELLAEVLENRDFLVGRNLSLADLFLFPVIFYLKQTPEGGRLLPDGHPVAAWHDKMIARDSAQQTMPELK